MKANTAIELVSRELQVLRRARDQASAQIVTANNALDAGQLVLADVSAIIERISACLDQVSDD